MRSPVNRVVIFERQRRNIDKCFRAFQFFAQDAVRSAQQIELVALGIFGAEDTDEDSRVFVVGRDVNVGDGQQAVGEARVAHFAPDDLGQHFPKLVLQSLFSCGGHKGFRFLLEQLDFRLRHVHARIAFDMVQRFVQDLIRVGAVGRDNGDADSRRAPDVVVADFGGGDIELASQMGQQAFQNLPMVNLKKK